MGLDGVKTANWQKIARLTRRLIRRGLFSRTGTLEEAMACVQGFVYF